MYYLFIYLFYVILNGMLHQIIRFDLTKDGFQIDKSNKELLYAFLEVQVFGEGTSSVPS